LAVAPTETLLSAWLLKDIASPCSLVVSPNGKLYTAAGNGEISMWDIKKESKPTLVADSNRDYCNPRLMLNEDGDLACWSWKTWSHKLLRIWDKETNQIKQSCSLADKWLGIPLPGNLVATLQPHEKAVKISDLKNSSLLHTIKVNCPPCVLAVSPDGCLVSGDANGVFNFYDIHGFELISSITLKVGCPLYMIWDQSSSKMLCACEGGLFTLDYHITSPHIAARQYESIFRFFDAHEDLSKMTMTFLTGDKKPEPKPRLG
jgi:WD40 repeat protein